MPDSIEGLADAVSQSSPNEFSTEIHVADKAGPKYNKNGEYKKKKGKAESTIEIADTPTSTPAYAEMGSVMATTVCSSFTMLMGPDWRPEQGELDAMAMAWAKYFESTGMTDFPPWLMLTMVHTGYIGKRLYMPDTRSRIQKIVDKFRRRKDARTNSGYDMQRENDASNQPNPPIQA